MSWYMPVSIFISNVTGGGDPLEMIDEDVVHELIGCGANMEGLRLLLMKEAIETDDE